MAFKSLGRELMISPKMWHHDLYNSSLKRCETVRINHPFSHLWMKTMILCKNHKSITLVKTKVVSNRSKFKLKDI